MIHVTKLKPISSLVFMVTVLLSPTTLHATGKMTCEAVSTDQWMSKDKVTKMLNREGWEVRYMKPDGGCWEVYGTDGEGRRVEAYLHPVTGEKLLISQRGKILFRKQ